MSSCAARWKLANHEKLPDPMNRCTGCEVGAEHAGERLIVVSPIQAHRVCCRCLRSASRLIRGVICVSCFNRELEVIKGRNAKGLPPVKHKPIGPHRIKYRLKDAEKDRRFERVVDATEAMVVMVHKHGTDVQFGFSAGYRTTWVQEALF